MLVQIAEGQRNGLVVPPGDAAMSVTKILKADYQCVALQAFQDYSQVNPTLTSSPVALKLLPRTPRPTHAVNPTPWMIDEVFVIVPEVDGAHLCGG